MRNRKSKTSPAGVLALNGGQLTRRSRAELRAEVEARQLPLEVEAGQATRDELTETLRWAARFDAEGKAKAQETVERLRLEKAARSIGTDLHRGARY